MALTPEEQAKLDTEFMDTFAKMGACKSPAISEKEFRRLADNGVKLLKQGANVNAKANGEMTPLLSACCDTRVVRFLIENGADVNAGTSKGYIALQTCTKNHDMFKYLLGRGAKLETSKADNILLGATYDKNTKLIETLVRQGTSEAGKATAMCGAISILQGRDSVDMLELMIKNGAPVDAVEPKKSDTPLICAVRHFNLDAASYLLDKGASARQKNKNEETAWLLSQTLSAPSGGGSDMEIRAQRIKQLLEKR